MRPVDEEDYRQRLDSGLTLRHELMLAKKNAESKRRWNTTESGRQDAVDLVDRAVQDRDGTVPLMLQLIAVNTMLKMEAQNQADDRVEAGKTDGREDEPRIVLVLPANGSEVRKGVEGEQGDEEVQ